MDLAERKYRLIKELVEVEDEAIIGNLERVLKKEEIHEKVSSFDEEELNKRLEIYKKDPQNLLDWEEVKNDW